MALNDDLIGQATEFAGDVAALLNRTVATGAHVGAVFDARNGHCRVATGISTRRMKAKPVPLTLGRGSPGCHLEVSHRFVMDRDGKHLADATSSYSVLRGPDEPLFRFEYSRNHPHHAEAHIHVIGTLTNGLPPGVKALQRLHLPVGGRRYRTSLEDVIEFLIREGFAEGRPGWETVVAGHRANYQRRQLMAAVRNDPQSALAQLRDDGHV